MWTPFHFVVFHPLVISGIALVLYGLFCIVYIPLYLLSFLVTPLGSVCVLLYCIRLLAVFVGTSIAFPGSTKSLQRDYSVDYIKRFSAQLEQTSITASNFASTVIVVIKGGVVAKIGSAAITQRFNELVVVTEALPSVRAWLTNVLESADAVKATADEISCIAHCKRSVELLTGAVLDIKNVLTRTPGFDLRSMNTAVQNKSFDKAAGIAIVNSASACLKASEDLKRAAISIRPVPATVDEQQSSAASVSNFIGSLAKFNSGPAGSAKFSFALMREQLKTSFGATRIFVVGCDANVIDGVIVPSKRRMQKRQSGGGSPFTSPSRYAVEPLDRRIDECDEDTSALGTVLFCSPNAGLYECAWQAQESSWLGFYTSLGFDVCMYNYRGYGSSEGSPSPDKLKVDGEFMVQHLRKNLKVTRLLVHGESIGGMVACHIARTCDVNMLVCDRTLTSLDSVAGRLLGRWASFGLRQLVRWRTDVCSDYMAAGCPKVVLQDAEDEVISYPSSLREGVALRMVIGDSTWLTVSMPRQYGLADFHGQAVPNTAEGGGALSDQLLSAAGEGDALIEPFFAHLMACLQHVHRQYDEALLRDRKFRSSDEGQTVDNTDAPMDFDDDLCVDEDGVEMTEEAVANSLGSPISGRGRPYLRFYMTLARIHGGSGQLLGGALRHGLDGLRCWICSYIIWSSRSRPDVELPSHSLSLTLAISELNLLAEKDFSAELARDDSVSFIIKALEVVAKRGADCANGAQTGLAVASTCVASQVEDRDEALCGFGADLGVGFVIPLHSGHNGWPTAQQLSGLRSAIAKVFSFDM